MESIFGRPIGSLEATDIRALVAIGAVEDFDLEFKEELYGRSDADKRALAGDVAALANSSGGVIIIGVTEDASARAVAAKGVDISDGERVRVLQVLAATVTPMPLVEVTSIALETDRKTQESSAAESDSTVPVSPQRGFFVIAVTQSPFRPHAVIVNGGFRYPTRNGASIRYLSEAETAIAYRERFAGERAQVERLDAVEAECIARLSREGWPWIVVSMIPDLPGRFQLDQVTFNRFRDVTMGKPAYEVLGSRYGVSFQRATVGRRRLLADGSRSEASLAQRVTAEYHVDGCGAYGLALPDLQESARRDHPGRGMGQLIDDEALAIGVLTGLMRLALHARDWAGTGGSALIRARLLPSPQILAGAQVGHLRAYGVPESRGRWAVMDDVAWAETAADIGDLAGPGGDLVAAAARLLDDIGQAFGIPEMGQLANDGRLRSKYWSRSSWEAVRGWAEAHSVLINDELLGQ